MALPGADDVSGVTDLDDAGVVRTADKSLVLDVDDLNELPDVHLTLDNLEGMTLGPRLPDGGRALVLMSDNNFTPGQVSQFLLFSARACGSRGIVSTRAPRPARPPRQAGRTVAAARGARRAGDADPGGPGHRPAAALGVRGAALTADRRAS